jgi:hypothetical protein
MAPERQEFKSKTMRKEASGQEREKRSGEQEDLAIWIARILLVGLDPR